jgi:uncharacterized DUF497 family protein
MWIKRLSDDEVIEKARWMWEKGVLHRTAHFEAELKNAGASMADIADVFFGECRVKKSEWNEAYRHWRYTISGHDLDGCELHLVVSIDIGNSVLILVTAF